MTSDYLSLIFICFKKSDFPVTDLNNISLLLSSFTAYLDSLKYYFPNFFKISVPNEDKALRKVNNICKNFRDIFSDIISNSSTAPSHPENQYN